MPERWRKWLPSEVSADHLFASRPQRLGALGIQGVGADTGAMVRVIVDLGNVAVFAVSPADVVCGRHDRRPHRGRGSLRDGLPVERRRGRTLAGVRRCDQRLDGLGLDRARMDRRGPDAVELVAAVELDREKNIGRLGTAIGCQRVIGRPLEIGIVEIDVGTTMTCRRDNDEAPARLVNGAPTLLRWGGVIFLISLRSVATVATGRLCVGEHGEIEVDDGFERLGGWAVA